MSSIHYSFKTTALALLALTASAWSQAACYTVYNGKNEAIYRSAQPPVDLSKPLHETQNQLPAGSRLVFTPDNNVCMTEVNELPDTKALKSTSANMVTGQLNLGSMFSVQ
jgi:hypothetical protein